MQIVINISEKIYESVMNGTYCGTLYQELKNGIALPKGHGRLVDADEILNHAHVEEDEDGDIFVKKWYCIEKDVFDNALVLIDGEGRKNEDSN